MSRNDVSYGPKYIIDAVGRNRKCHANLPSDKFKVDSRFRQREELIDRLIPRVEFINALSNLSVHCVDE